MPDRLTLVRHGLSEQNAVTNMEKDGLIHPDREDVFLRPDYMQRLMPEGREQARIAGEWMRNNGLDPADYDERYSSMYYRSLETANIIGPGLEWLPDFRIVERDWGEYGAVPKELRAELYPHIEQMRKLASLFIRYTGGQSMLDKCFDFKDFIGTLSREQSGKSVVAVVHGETMWAGRFVLERMMPHEYHQLDESKTERIGNCTILDYVSINPEDPEDHRASLSDGWRRQINPLEPEKSPYGGEWQKLPGKRRLGDLEIQAILDTAPQLIHGIPNLAPVDQPSLMTSVFTRVRSLVQATRERF